MKLKLVTPFLFLTSLSLISCSNQLKQGSSPRASISSDRIEVLTMLDVAREEIQSTELSFAVDWERDTATRERVIYFFEKYAQHPEVAIPYERHIRGEKELLVSPSGTNTFQYAVLRSPLGGRVAYQVACKGPQPAASMNARNLSRFLQSGVLELALLD